MCTTITHHATSQTWTVWRSLPLTISILVLSLVNGNLFARSVYHPQAPLTRQTTLTHSAFEPVARTHRAGSFALTIPQGGLVGTGFFNSFISDGSLPAPSFEFPQNSQKEYLFGGGLWIGAIADDDTLVSVAVDGWAAFDSLIVSRDKPGVRNTSGFADENFVTFYSDSLADWPSLPNNPGALGIEVEQRSMVWKNEPNNDFAIIEYHIRNALNADTLREIYAGLYMDCDISNRGEQGGFMDDIAGFLPNEGIAYIADNDGSPIESVANPGTVWTEKSTRAALGAKILDIRYSGNGVVNPPSFNWWISNGNPMLDFGPRRAGTSDDPFRDFGGFLGTPEGDRNKYYILSHPEQDYDQIETALDHSADGWLPPPASSSAVDFSDGFDTRFLLSQGGVSLPPGDSLTIVVAIAIGDNVHVNPTDFFDTFNPLDPDAFRNTLDFSDLKRNIAAAESLYVSGYKSRITSPPPTPKLDDTLALEPLMSWIFSANPSVEAYDVYLAKAPDSSVLCQYALLDTPQFLPENKIATVTSDTFRLTGLEDGAWYAAAVAVHPLPDSTTLISEPVVFKYGVPRTPIWDSSMFVNDDQTHFQYVSAGPEVTLRWKPQNSDIDHYNIYRLPDSLDGWLTISRIFHSLPGVDTCRSFPDGPIQVLCSGERRDGGVACLVSLLPHEQIPGDRLSYTDTPPAPAKHIYTITAVDSAGNESAPLSTVLGYATPAERRAVAMIVNDTFLTTNPNAPGSPDLFAFYQRTLASYNPDYLKRIVRPVSPGHWPPRYADIATYKTIIIDGSTHFGLVMGITTIDPNYYWLLDYTRSGGTIVDVGTDFAFNRSAAAPPQLVRTSFSGRLRPGKINTGYDIFGLDSIIMVPPQTGAAAQDSVNRTYRTIEALAEPGSGFPNLTYHHSGFYSDSLLNTGPIPFKGVMFPRAENTEVLYTWVDAGDTATDFAGLPIGVKYTPVTHTAYILISNPWEWEPDQTRAFFAKILGDFPTDVTDDDTPLLPKTLTLRQNYPNPFNPSTQISYYLATRSQVSLVVYNILGQKVRTLVNEVKDPGEHVVTWDANEYASGIYFYRLQADGVKLSKKMVLLK